MKTIASFDGDYAFLSNFYVAPFSWRERTWQTVEHAFQAAKAVTDEDFARVADAKGPGAAKQLGRRIRLRPDWEQVKEGIMLELLRAKFAPSSPLAAQLLATGRAELVEGNHWNDRYWGVCQGKGKNRLGALLMQVREELGAPQP